MTGMFYWTALHYTGEPNKSTVYVVPFKIKQNKTTTLHFNEQTSLQNDVCTDTRRLFSEYIC